ncbi:cupin domain-containing protein [Paenibacillus alginolyticus]|uniref:D-lyxose/D-mannose family sugar isomerase n=1 Tax=Paenibacillus alginolyticus TaxID=59839 RepID=A0ABT4GK99_9BACL|nr:D-lyxose/D-mannose family sugar isomerase [Paenibacillus alginolyticus]MCY9696627.1 D-lyxose/D-mannose family sugar isomerase [Paenibacillus alginolyticus]MEC0145238.1 D-lyxose/D-mannose family sugar isomerase [Paenibacillus alginolyticus]
MNKNMTAEEIRQQALALLELAHIPLSADEKAGLQLWDFGLNNPARYGIQIVEYINNDRYCARQLVMLPRQTVPEHRHPPIGEDPGKAETFRVVWGKVWAYVDGKPTGAIAAEIVEEDKPHFSALRQIELHAGEQYTIGANVSHWFHAGDDGAVVIEFSSPAQDKCDIFKDPRVSN